MGDLLLAVLTHEKQKEKTQQQNHFFNFSARWLFSVNNSALTVTRLLGDSKAEFTCCVVVECVVTLAEIPGGGGRGYSLYLTLHCHHQNGSCIKRGSNKSHFNVVFIHKKTVSTNLNLSEEKG